MSSEIAPAPSHHPAPEDLLEYATGTGAEWLSLLVACHLTFCERCRREVAMLDEVGAALMDAAGNDDADDAWVGAAADDAAARISERTTADDAGAAGGMPAQLAGTVPRPLRPYLSEPGGRWRFLAPGIQHVPLQTPDDDVQLRLIKFRAGFVIPPHGHEGLEWLLILDGDIGDSHTGTRYGRGDVCCSDVDKEHSQDVSPSEPCIALVANLGPLIPKTMLGRVLAKIVKI
ncbi:MAG: ChrR family anti-sigma-E factor [Myxococcales bacterium]|nr:ChrR family anti-sigma-E factor [Myxococcales bacterium]